MTTSPPPDDDATSATSATGTPIPPGPSGQPVETGRLVELDRPSVAVARYADYASAQRAVDFLSDNGFPVERTSIIGTDLRLVETVLGRMTVGRAALAGLASGAWFGLFIGFLFTLFTTSSWFAVLLASIAIGAVWGAILFAVAHALTGGRRDFTSRSSLEAREYAVTVDSEVADEARTLITRMTWRESGAQ
jgi:hypothetical protein